MSEVVDYWVDQLKGAPKVGSLTHMERATGAFDLLQTDLVPVMPELDQWQIVNGGYTFPQIYDDVDKATDAVLRTWAETRADLIWQYVDLSHQLDPFIAPDQRSRYFDLRGGTDYVLFRPITKDLDELIAMFEGKVWEKNGPGRAASHFVPHIQQLAEFQRKMGDTVPICTGAASPSNQAETIVEVQTFIGWLVTEPKDKLHHLFELVTEERCAAIDAYKEFAADFGVKFFCMWGGARTWGPRQLDEFAKYDAIYARKVAECFEYPFWHICGNNLPRAMEWINTIPAKAVQYDEPMSQLKLSWPDWCEWVARLYAGKKCVMNAPTTQVALHGTVEEVETMVRQFLDRSLPHTTAAVMPGCELSTYTPKDNVQAMIRAGRSYRGG